MSRIVRRRWHSTRDRHLPQRDRQGCEYDAYIPDPLMSRTFRLDGDVAADVADAEASILRLNAEGVAMAEAEALARILLRAESVASSHIEGLVIGGRRLLRAELAQATGERAGDVTAGEVLANIDAMRWAVDSIARTGVTVDGMLQIHRRLMAASALAAGHGGRLRTEQNWIGGSGYSPCSAVFVPPPPDDVPGLVDDLCAFCADDSLSPVVQAAVAHAQFETIHPFVDGNGRTGRALIQVILRRRGVAPRWLPPVSLVLATQSRTYAHGLQVMRYRGRSDSKAAHEGLNEWVGIFAAACQRAVVDAQAFEDRVGRATARWRASLGRVRGDSAVDRLLAVLPGAPVTTVSQAAELIGRSAQATNEAFRRLEEADVVRQLTVGRRNRAFEAPAIVRAFTDLERRLASPEGNTGIAPPSRPTPPRAPG